MSKSSFLSRPSTQTLSVVMDTLVIMSLPFLTPIYATCEYGNLSTQRSITALMGLQTTTFFLRQDWGTATLNTLSTVVYPWLRPGNVPLFLLETLTTLPQALAPFLRKKSYYHGNKDGNKDKSLKVFDIITPIIQEGVVMSRFFIDPNKCRVVTASEGLVLPRERPPVGEQSPVVTLDGSEPPARPSKPLFTRKHPQNDFEHCPVHNVECTIFSVTHARNA